MPSTPLTIKEVTGEKRIVELSGPGLPREWEINGIQRTEIMYYAGNPVGTAQVLGAKEEPTTLSGVWKQTLLTNQRLEGVTLFSGPSPLSGGEASQPFITDPTEIAVIFDDIRRKGQLLEVNWDIFVRVGILTSFTARFIRREVCEWEMTFDWLSQGEFVAPPRLEVTDLNVNTSFLGAVMQGLNQALGNRRCYRVR